MTESVPTVTIEPSPVNDIVLVMSSVVPAHQLGDFVADPAAVYERHRAEIRLVSDLLFPSEELPPSAEPRAAGPSDDFVVPDPLHRERILR